jgi:hypothetical protein
MKESERLQEKFQFIDDLLWVIAEEVLNGKIIECKEIFQ